MLKRTYISIRQISLSVLMIISITSYGQSEKRVMANDSARNHVETSALKFQGDYQIRCLKIRLLPWFASNSAGLSGMIGVEYGFWKRHSIGLDFGFLSQSDYRDAPGNSNSPGLNSFEIDRAFVANYRFYFDFEKPHDGAASPNFYVGLMARYGWGNQFLDLGYSKDNLTSQQDNHVSEAFLIGVLFKSGDHPEKSRVFFDFNIGPLYKQTDVTNIYTRNQQNVYVQGQLSSYNLHIGLTLNFWFTR